MKPALILLALIVSGLSVQTAKAKDLVTALSSDLVSIQSNFAGTKIVVFGQIDRNLNQVAEEAGYELAVTIEGPKQNITTRRKARLVGVWVNRYYETFTDVPSFYAVASTSPVSDLASREVLDELQIGLNHLNLAVTGKSHVPLSDRDDFRRAFVRLREEAGLYSERPETVEFLTDSMFRTSVPLPANIPVGQYMVRSSLFQNGELISRTEAPLIVAKSGFEQVTYDMAKNQPLVYGLIAVALAMITGWFAGVIFRKD